MLLEQWPKSHVAVHTSEFDLVSIHCSPGRVSSILSGGKHHPMASEAPILNLESVTKRYDRPDRSGSLTVLESISLEVGRAESLAIVGPSGSGKSTLLQIMGTLDHPTSGIVQLNGQDLGTLDDAQLA